MERMSQIIVILIFEGFPTSDNLEVYTIVSEPQNPIFQQQIFTQDHPFIQLYITF